MAEKRGLEPPSRGKPTTRFPSGPTAIIALLRIGGEGETRTLMSFSRTLIFGTGRRSQSPSSPFGGRGGSRTLKAGFPDRRISNPVPYHWATLPFLITERIVIQAHRIPIQCTIVATNMKMIAGHTKSASLGVVSVAGALIWSIFCDFVPFYWELKPGIGT